MGVELIFAFITTYTSNFLLHYCVACFCLQYSCANTTLLYIFMRFSNPIICFTGKYFQFALIAIKLKDIGTLFSELGVTVIQFLNGFFLGMMFIIEVSVTYRLCVFRSVVTGYFDLHFPEVLFSQCYLSSLCFQECCDRLF